MRLRVQVKYVTEHMHYLEEKIHVMKPVVEALQGAVDKSMTWLEDKSDNESLTYCDLCQELESATLTMLNVAAHILDENKDIVENGRSFSSQSTSQTTATEECGSSQSTDQVLNELYKPSEILSRLEQIETAISSLQDVSRLEQIETAISSLQDVSRLEQIETAISSLQDIRDKSTNAISEIKQWRDNFVTKQIDMGVNIEQLVKRQKQNFKNLRKQMSEQDNKVKELNKEIESLKEKESKSNKTLEKLSLDIKGYENNLLKINKDMQDHADKSDIITQEIKRHSDQMSTLQEESYKIQLNTSTQLEKHSLMYKLLQQRLMPIDKLIQIFNKNLETREERITKLENIEGAISKLSKDLNIIESRVCNRYACHVEFDDPTPVSTGSIISRFTELREYNGQHFDQTTGKFISPHDGLYLVCVTLHEWVDKQIIVGVWAGDVMCTTIDVKCANTSAAGSVVVDMKKGQEIYLKVSCADQGAMLSNFSSFTIVSL